MGGKLGNLFSDVFRPSFGVTLNCCHPGQPGRVQNGSNGCQFGIRLRPQNLGFNMFQPANPISGVFEPTSQAQGLPWRPLRLQRLVAKQRSRRSFGPRGCCRGHSDLDSWGVLGDGSSYLWRIFKVPILTINRVGLLYLATRTEPSF